MAIVTNATQTETPGETPVDATLPAKDAQKLDDPNPQFVIKDGQLVRPGRGLKDDVPKDVVKAAKTAK